GERETMDFRLPELGEGVYEAELVAWQVKPGDAVRRGQDLVEVLTDKATMEVPAPFAGTITDLRAEPGQRVKVGDVILAYEAAGDKANNPAPPAPEPVRSAARVEARTPALRADGPPARNALSPAP